jgi:D-alanyl-D-alanine carboxypeptidase (penicillin-binding protein 5/6)
MRRMRIALGGLIVIGVWAAAVVLATPIDDRGNGADAAAIATAGLPSPITNDPGTRPPVHNRFTVRAAAPPTAVRVHFKQQPRAGVLFDMRSGEVLWQLHPLRELPIASLTKMMTALIIAERHKLRERVTITPRVLGYAGSGVGVLPRGKRVKLGALLYGLLLVSGNDAAIALAQHDAHTIAGFVRRMNRRAQQLGLTCTRFSTPSGIKDAGNHSCPLDLATLARLDLANPVVRRIVGTRRVRMRFPIKACVLDLFNINPFIDDPGVTGVKTGLTNAAGRCYVVTAHVNGRYLGVVLLNTPDPFMQVPRLMQAGARIGAAPAGAQAEPHSANP